MAKRKCLTNLYIPVFRIPFKSYHIVIYLRKVIKFIKINNNEWFEEAKSLSDYHHKNVVKYEDHFELRTKESMRHPCILTEYCQVTI